ncbi:BamA/TamA family outer membrane protein [Flavobacterium sp. DG1-102-2]|uniref:translocation and assembly module lipoprotein TamL n=1 Tax=Flavobacterium sp. DG1-102-2 TaxID=3081663 RepID=UPI0029492938|nr:BamA/TamA family outer membrane protein [Flavobacterium sp. DG1-102-2]MDV6168932.1 BamA/TamA family outer membrane protein [Flavobacterium sp. DG1-102-2]
MRNKTTKIALIILSGLILYSCSLVKRVPDGKHLLEKADITVNGEKKTDDEVKNLLYQEPNTDILGYHLRLHLFNLAKPNADSSYHAWLDRKPGRHERMKALLSEKQVQRLGNSFVVTGYSNFLKKVGEPPVIVDVNRTKKSRNRLFAYYYKQGFFRASAGFKIDTLGDKRAAINYDVITGKPYMLDSIAAFIESPALDSLYNATKKNSVIKKGQQYNEANFTAERERITNYFRNHGAYYFQQNNVNYVVDTVNNDYKANVELVVDNESLRRGDSTVVRPFKLYKISKVNIYTTNPTSADQSIDSTKYKDFNIYSTGKLNYRPKAITDAIFITQGSTYSDIGRVRSSRYLSNLRVFNSPSISYIEDPNDPTGQSLITNITLTPRKKFRFNVTADFTHSNIQDFGISGSLGVTIRNLFRGAETLEISTRGNIGSSRDGAIKDRAFFNILEYGADMKLTLPRIFFPLNTDKVIPKEMLPSTVMSLGTSRQKNIGLDKENFTGVLSYNWTPKRNRTARLDLFNVQYIRNINPSKYFSVYDSSYDRVNEIADTYRSQIPESYLNTNGDLDRDNGKTELFINDVNNDVIQVSQTDKDNIESIEERRVRLTENNLIFATNYTYTTTSRENINDNTFFIFKTKVESAGALLSLIGGTVVDPNGSNTGRTLFNVAYSQYLKGELDFIKHWDLRRGKVLAMRAFFGLAIPYGNSTSIPFTRSYFAGGSNDNRGWQPYSLGPGSSGGVNDFNEANLKLAYSAELRFNIFGKLNGAIFGDVGNIWNVFDEEKDKSKTFNGLESFKDLALGTGIGFRYDFNFFVVRFDLGFKTYNPGREENDRWFKEYNLSKSVLNVGINYPF